MTINRRGRDSGSTLSRRRCATCPALPPSPTPTPHTQTPLPLRTACNPAPAVTASSLHRQGRHRVATARVVTPGKRLNSSRLGGPFPLSRLPASIEHSMKLLSAVTPLSNDFRSFRVIPSHSESVIQVSRTRRRENGIWSWSSARGAGSAGQMDKPRRARAGPSDHVPSISHQRWRGVILSLRGLSFPDTFFPSRRVTIFPSHHLFGSASFRVSVFSSQPPSESPLPSHGMDVATD